MESIPDLTSPLVAAQSPWTLRTSRLSPKNGTGLAWLILSAYCRMKIKATHQVRNSLNSLATCCRSNLSDRSSQGFWKAPSYLSVRAHSVNNQF